MLRCAIKFRLFSDSVYLPDGVPLVGLLRPFWDFKESLVVYNQALYNRYQFVGADIFDMTSLEEAQAAVLPFVWKRAASEPMVQQTQRMAADAAQAGKPLVVFYDEDYENPLPIQNSIVFRTSLTRSHRQPNEFVLPGWSTDIADQYLAGEIQLREKHEQPVIGFCGDISSGQSLSDKVKRMLSAQPSISWLSAATGVELNKHPGSRIRLKALRILARSEAVQRNFILRYGYWNGAIYRGRVIDPDLAERSRREYVDNMLNSDYILCIRGKGNFSFRLYETLSCGRIPVFVNTDCVLPYEEHIDWRQYCVWVEESELSHLADCITDFHNHLSPRQFIELQHACRQLWLDWVSPSGYFANFYRHFA